MTEKITIYSAEFKAEAVEKIAENNDNLLTTAKRLGILALLCKGC